MRRLDRPDERKLAMSGARALGLQTWPSRRRSKPERPELQTRAARAPPNFRLYDSRRDRRPLVFQAHSIADGTS